MYMPGLRALTGGMVGHQRARIAALYTSRRCPLIYLGLGGHRLGLARRLLFTTIAGLASLMITWAVLPRSVV
jgi:hypothetical protein